MRALITMLVAFNPPALAAALPTRLRRDVMAATAAAGTTLAAVVAALSAPVLDALDVTPGTFRVAAAVVLGVAGVRWLALGPWILPDDVRQGSWRQLVVPLLVPVLVTPQLVAVSISIGADQGVAIVVLGATAAMVFAWLMTSGGLATGAWSAGSRFVGMVAVVLAVAMAVDGVRSV